MVRTTLSNLVLIAGGVANMVTMAILPVSVYAQNIQAIQQQISDRNDGIELLEREIAQYQTELESISKEANTLQNTVRSLELSQKKIEADLKVTQAKIDSANGRISNLSQDITTRNERILFNQNTIKESIKIIHKNDSVSLVEILLGDLSLSSFFEEADSIKRIQDGVSDVITELEESKKTLETNKKAVENQRAQLLSLRQDLSNQNKLLANTKADQASLLSATKNTEAEYRKIINEKVAQKVLFEQEIFKFESDLKIAINPSSVPKPGSGVLSWPLASVTVTQYFGNTPFATRNPQGYGGQGHNGIDLRAPVGTKVFAPADGIVVSVGDTGLIRGCFSYGRWVMLKHPNGLSTLFAHLSTPLVKTGQAVSRGDVIAYSGNTGYSTGPHLHFGVYLTEAVRITTLTTSRNCNGAIVPISDPQGYMNPLSYL